MRFGKYVFYIMLVVCFAFISCGNPQPPPDIPVIEPEPESEPNIAIIQNKAEDGQTPATSVKPNTDIPVSNQSNLTIDDMEEFLGWHIYEDANARLKTSIAPGYRGRSLKIEYDLGRGKFCGVWKEIGNGSAMKGIKFTLRCEGSKNTLEIKLEDKHRTTFGRLIPTIAAGWTTIVMPFSTMTYLWGENKNLDTSKLKLNFAISFKDGDAGGMGAVYIDKVEFIE